VEAEAADKYKRDKRHFIIMKPAARIAAKRSDVLCLFYVLYMGCCSITALPPSADPKEESCEHVGQK
jgi:hypothetical protein